MTQITRAHPSVVRVTADVKDLPQRTLHILVRSDAHCDSPVNRWDREEEHLELIRKKEGIIVDLGDMFDAMQGRHDPRADPSEIVPEMVGADYSDRLIEFAWRRYKKYAPYWAVLMSGNHETKFEMNYGTSLTRRIADKMQCAGSNVQALDYSGYLILSLSLGNRKTRFVMKLLHGSGGAAMATGGAAKDIYRAATYVDADIICSGHIHQDRTRKTQVERINNSFVPYWSKQAHIVCPGYKDEAGSTRGWAVEKEFKPGPVGAYLFTFSPMSNSGRQTISEQWCWTYRELE